MIVEPKEIFIIGAGGFGREVVDTIHEINKNSNKYNIAGFIDEDESIINTYIYDIKVIGNIDYFRNEICNIPHFKRAVSYFIQDIFSLKDFVYSDFKQH